MLGRNLINFAKGNAAGIGAATLMTVVARPYIKGKIAYTKARGLIKPDKMPAKEVAGTCHFLNLMKDDIPTTIRWTYSKYGAPKSGAFWTQSVGDFFKSIAKKWECNEFDDL